MARKFKLFTTIFAPVCILTIGNLSFLQGCKTSEVNPSHETNNGPYTDLSTNRAKVTVSLALESKANQKTLRFCTGTIVKDPVFGTDPVIITAAHCDPYDWLLSADTSFNESKPIRDHKIFNFIVEIPSQKTSVRISEFRQNPHYDPEKSLNDLAVATINPEDIPKIKFFASIEKNYESFVNADRKISAQLDQEIQEVLEGKDQSHDQLTFYKHSFDLKSFDKSQSAQLIGFGMENNGTGMGLRYTPSDKESCLANKDDGALWDEQLGCSQFYSVGIESNDKLPRHVVMKIAKIDTRNSIAVFVPRASFPKEGTCQGDSGGPSFLGMDDSTRLFAVESWGPSICAGSFTVRSIVVPGLAALAKALRAPYPSIKQK